jgi:hypothetical protein
MRYNPYGDLADFCANDVAPDFVGGYGVIANSLDIYRGYSSAAAQMNSFSRSAYNTTSGGNLMVDTNSHNTYSVMRATSCEVADVTRSFGSPEEIASHNLYGVGLAATSIPPLPAISYCVPRNRTSPPSSSSDFLSMHNHQHSLLTSSAVDYLAAARKLHMPSATSGTAKSSNLCPTDVYLHHQQPRTQLRKQQDNIDKKKQKQEQEGLSSTNTLQEHQQQVFITSNMISTTCDSPNSVKREKSDGNIEEKKLPLRNEREGEQEKNAHENADDDLYDDEAEDMTTTSRLSNKITADVEDDKDGDNKVKTNGIVFYPWMKRVHGGGNGKEIYLL